MFAQEGKKLDWIPLPPDAIQMIPSWMRKELEASGYAEGTPEYEQLFQKLLKPPEIDEWEKFEPDE